MVGIIDSRGLVWYGVDELGDVSSDNVRKRFANILSRMFV